MNILIIEDEPLVATSIKRIFTNVPFANIIEVAYDFDTAFTKAMSNVFDVMLVDIYLGKDSLTGLDLCKSVRKANAEVILIIITAHNSIKYLEKAFALGVNDYITKPFSFKEVELRTKRWLLLLHKVTTENVISYQELSYSPQKDQVYFKNKSLHLTKQAKLLLFLFLKHPEQILSQVYIQEKIWGDYDTSKNRNVRSNVQLLRATLPDSCRYWIQNIRGKGYRISCR
jgi:DNA-binding response OmpR family regulator